MIYEETEQEMGVYYYSFCAKILGKKYPQWMIPCRILEITPAEYVKLLVEEYNCTVHWYPPTHFLERKWSSRTYESRWRLFINKKAREKGFRV